MKFLYTIVNDKYKYKYHHFHHTLIIKKKKFPNQADHTNFHTVILF